VGASRAEIQQVPGQSVELGPSGVEIWLACRVGLDLLSWEPGRAEIWWAHVVLGPGRLMLMGGEPGGAEICWAQTELWLGRPEGRGAWQSRVVAPWSCGMEAWHAVPGVLLVNCCVEKASVS
jgi:hypothetical protein